MALALFLLLTHLRARDASAAPSAAAGPDADHDGIIAIDPPLPMSDVALTTHMGASASLSDLRGQVTLLAFGFLHCPDICPLTLHEMLRTREMLGDAAARAGFVFVSVDGARDTPEAMRHYLAFREMDGILGMTGPEEKVRQAGETLGIAFEISQDEAPGGYLVNHTAGFFLLDEEARWIRRYHFGVSARAIADDMRRLITG